MEINELIEECHRIAVEHGFWTVEKSIPAKLMLITSELGEAMEADRKGDTTSFNREIADVLIRTFDLCGALDIDIESELKRKIEINKRRDYLHGKKY